MDEVLLAVFLFVAATAGYVAGVSHGYAQGIHGEALTWSLVSGSQ